MWNKWTTGKEIGPVKEGQRRVRVGRETRVVHGLILVEEKLILVAERLDRMARPQYSWICTSLETTTDSDVQVSWHQEDWASEKLRSPLWFTGPGGGHGGFLRRCWSRTESVSVEGRLAREEVSRVRRREVGTGFRHRSGRDRGGGWVSGEDGAESCHHSSAAASKWKAQSTHTTSMPGSTRKAALVVSGTKAILWFSFFNSWMSSTCFIFLSQSFILP